MVRKHAGHEGCHGSLGTLLLKPAIPCFGLVGALCALLCQPLHYDLNYDLLRLMCAPVPYVCSLLSHHLVLAEGTVAAALMIRLNVGVPVGIMSGTLRTM